MCRLGLRSWERHGCMDVRSYRTCSAKHTCSMAAMLPRDVGGVCLFVVVDSLQLSPSSSALLPPELLLCRGSYFSLNQNRDDNVSNFGLGATHFLCSTESCDHTHRDLGLLGISSRVSDSGGVLVTAPIKRNQTVPSRTSTHQNSISCSCCLVPTCSCAQGPNSTMWSVLRFRPGPRTETQRRRPRGVVDQCTVCSRLISDKTHCGARCFRSFNVQPPPADRPPALTDQTCRASRPDLLSASLQSRARTRASRPA